MSLLHCCAFAWLNDCANGDEADFTYVQTQKTQSLITHLVQFSMCTAIINWFDNKCKPGALPPSKGGGTHIGE